MSKESGEPYAAFGAKIKYLREQWQQTTTEVSTTLEIDEEMLKQIESGKILPPENLLDMLISHFLLTDDQAEDLRALAIDSETQTAEGLAGGIEEMLMKQIVMYMPVDNKIVYTDTMKATVGKHGVVLQFMQSQGEGKSIPVSQVGMSREHAEKVVEIIRKTLDHHDQSTNQKFLPSPEQDKK